MKNLFLLFALLISLPAYAQVALLAHTAAGFAGTGGGASPVTTTAINTTGASMIAICASSDPHSTVAPTDSAGNLWLLAKTQNEDGDSRVSLWYAIAPVTSPSHTFTGHGQAPSVAVMAFSNVASGPDQLSSSQSYKSPLTSGNLTPANPDELILSCISAYPAAFTANVSAPLTVVDSLPWNGGYNGSVATASAFAVETTAAPVNPAWNFTSGKCAGATVAASFFSTLAPAPLAVTTTRLPEGFAGRPYSTQLQNSGGIGPFTWTLTSGTLPNGLSLSSSGAITGTASSAIAAPPLTFKVTDSTARTASSSGLALTIASAQVSVAAKDCTLTGTQYKPFGGCTISAAGGTPPYTYSWSVVTDGSFAAIPEGLVLNPSTGAISGTVYGQGGYVTQFAANDSVGTKATVNVKFALAGDNTSGGCSIFPADSIFHRNIANLPVDNSPAAPIYSAYLPAKIHVFFGGAPVGSIPNGVPFIRVPRDQPMVPVTTTLYQSYFSSAPIPPFAPVENTSNRAGSDGHVLVLQTASGGQNCALWEMWQGVYQGGASGAWSVSSSALWPNIGTDAMLPEDKGSSDAAGLPILPLLLNADEVIGAGTPSAPKGAVQHPTRFTVTHMLNSYVWPATAHAGTGSCTGGYHDANRMLLQSNPPTSCTMTGPAGEIYRLKASVPTPACAVTSPQAAIIIQGFRDYGIILADNGRSGGLIGTPDSRWNDSDLACLTNITLSNFEPVNVSSIIVNPTASYQAVSRNVNAIAITPASATIPTGGFTQQYSAACTYSDGSTSDCTSTVTWTSNSASVAKISSSGLASGIAAGGDTITATSGTVTGTAPVTVYTLPAGCPVPK